MWLTTPADIWFPCISRGRAGWDEEKVMRGRHLSFRRDGKRLQPEELALCNELALWIPLSKADQFNQGQLLVHHMTERIRRIRASYAHSETSA